MNESNVVKFMNIADCDRRTACFCLSEFNGNMDLAISFYYDTFLANNAKVPEKFSLEDCEKHCGLSTTTMQMKPVQEVATPTESIFERKYPIEDEIKVPEFLHRKRTVQPEVFFPNPQISHVIKEQGPALVNEEACGINLLMKHTYVPSGLRKVHINITVWADGVQFNDKFVPKDEPRYNEIMDDINHGRIPKVIEVDTTDIELFNRSTENHQ